MGSGNWSSKAYRNYSTTMGRSVDNRGYVTTSYASANDMFRSRALAAELNPRNAIRECRDSDEHPNTKPVILALDVTGSMGNVAMLVAKSLNPIISKLYEDIADIEFMIMGIGDFEYDYAPLQVSQFESDIRIAHQLDKLYFEGMGGGNGYESYSAAWAFAAFNTDCDCWKRGEKGTLITLGDEPLNPYLPHDRYSSIVGNLETISTENIYKLASQHWNIYHIPIGRSFEFYRPQIYNTWSGVIGENNIRESTLDNLPMTITDIIKESLEGQGACDSHDEGISW